MAIPTGTKIPSSGSGFMKFELGQNRLRVLGDFQIGWEGWINGKPTRHRGDVCHIDASIVDQNKDGTPNMHYFWVAPVYDYRDQAVRVLEITQKTIMGTLQNLEENPAWGDVKKYDLVVSKTKNGDKTSYAVVANPPTVMPNEILTLLEESKAQETIDKMFDMVTPKDDDLPFFDKEVTY